MASRLDHIADWDALAFLAEFSAAKLAALCGVTPRHLRRYFRARFGMSLQHRLDSLRLNQGAELILHGWSVKAVAAELGWEKPSNFCEAFKKHFGMPPLSYFTTQQHSKAKLRLPLGLWPCGRLCRRPDILALLGRSAARGLFTDAATGQNPSAAPKNGKSRAQSGSSASKMSALRNNVRAT